MQISRRAVYVFVLVFSTAFLSGCTTLRRQKDLELQGMRNQVQALEAQIQEKDRQINDLKDRLDSSEENKEIMARDSAAKGIIPEAKSRPTARKIQIALKNAGYNPGTLDGRIGKQTRDAIKAFQRANNLVADGRVGKKTWRLLKEYLYKKIK